jgi:hypothetical protein
LPAQHKNGRCENSRADWNRELFGEIAKPKPASRPTAPSQKTKAASCDAAWPKKMEAQDMEILRFL